MSEDLFSCFGSDEEGENHSEFNSIEAAEDERDDNCGVLSFHPNTEQSLLIHLKNTVSPTNEAQVACAQVLAETDDFCIKRHWMMHVGPQKGDIIATTLQEAIDTFVSRNSDEKSFICVEIGTYCGYGSVFLGKVLLENAARYEEVNFHLYTVEINPSFRKIATDVIKLAQLDSIVSLLEIDLKMNGETSDIGDLLKAEINKQNRNESHTIQTQIHFLMIDHDKDKYLEDLLLIEKSGLVKSGSVVCADNVVFAKIDDYIQFQRGRSDIVSTETKLSMVEYCSPDLLGGSSQDNYIDGVGKLLHFQFKLQEKTIF